MVPGKCHGHPSCDSNGGSGDEVCDADCQDHGHPACDKDGGSIGRTDDSIGCDCDVNGSVMLMIVVLVWLWWYWCDCDDIGVTVMIMVSVEVKAVIWMVMALVVTMMLKVLMVDLLVMGWYQWGDVMWCDDDASNVGNLLSKSKYFYEQNIAQKTALFYIDKKDENEALAIKTKQLNNRKRLDYPSTLQTCFWPDMFNKTSFR